MSFFRTATSRVINCSEPKALGSSMPCECSTPVASASTLPGFSPTGPRRHRRKGEPITLPSAIAKLFAGEMAVRVAEDCVQIHGGYGFVKDYPAEKYFRDVKLTTIGEGTSEIQRLIIARHLVRAATAA
jgi:Acyl-CoA dehydrogenase, C-terminal domain